MCRWMAWREQPVLTDELQSKREHGPIDHGLDSCPGPETPGSTTRCRPASLGRVASD